MCNRCKQFQTYDTVWYTDIYRVFKQTRCIFKHLFLSHISLALTNLVPRNNRAKIDRFWLRRAKNTALYKSSCYLYTMCCHKAVHIPVLFLSFHSISRPPLSNRKETRHTHDVHIKEHRGAFVPPLLQWKSNKYYTTWACICRLRYPARNAHVPNCHLWPARL